MRKILLYGMAFISIINAFGNGINEADIIAAIYTCAAFILSAIDNK